MHKNGVNMLKKSSSNFIVLVLIIYYTGETLRR